MKNTGVVGVIAAVLLLSGCASAGAESAPKVTVTADVPTATPEPAPITATPAPTPEETGFGMGDYTPDEFFIAIMDRYWQGDNRPDDAALIGAAQLACQDMTSGNARESVTVVEGDPENNRRVVQFAAQVYCPEFS